MICRNKRVNFLMLNCGKKLSLLVLPIAFLFSSSLFISLMLLLKPIEIHLIHSIYTKLQRRTEVSEKKTSNHQTGREKKRSNMRL